MPDIYSIHATHKLLWIKRLIDETKRKRKILTKALLGISSEFLYVKLPEKFYIQCAKNKYYQQLLDFWYSFKNRAPTCTEEIKCEYLLYNGYISVAGSCLTIAIVGNKNQNLKIQLHDIIDNAGNFISFDAIKTKLSIKITFLEYLSITKVIAKEWLEKLKLHKCEGKPSDKGLTVSVCKIMKPLSKLKSQDIYWELINNKSNVPTSLRIWIDLFPFLESANWAKFFKLANKVTCEPFLQTFQYKLDWANSAPTYPQTGHHSRHRF